MDVTISLLPHVKPLAAVLMVNDATLERLVGFLLLDCYWSSKSYRVDILDVMSNY